MKALLASLCVLAISATTHAASSLGYDFRGDFNSTNYNNDSALPPAYQKFYLKTGRIYFKGQLNDRISYELRWGFYKPSDVAAGANTQRDSLNSSVEYANVTDKMSDMFSLQVGKLNSELGGFEGATSGADLYMVSSNYAHNGAVGLTGKNLGINQGGEANLLYITGMKGDLSFMDQHVYLLYANNVGGDAIDQNSKFNQNRGLMGVIWKGSFMDKAITGLLSYHEVATQAVTVAPTDSGNKHMFYSAGVKYEDAQMVGSLEYNGTEYKDGLTGNKDTLYSVVGKYGYKFEQFIPRIELFSSEEKVGIGATTGTNKIMGYGAVLEYKPTADNFRYHVAYNTITTKPNAGNDQTRNEIVVGARLFGDWLK
jgi:hypothetical protein